MKLFSACLIAAVASLSITTILNAQQPRESADPYYQPEGSTSPAKNNPVPNNPAINNPAINNSAIAQRPATETQFTNRPTGLQPNTATVAKPAVSNTTDFLPATTRAAKTSDNFAPFSPSPQKPKTRSFAQSNPATPATDSRFEPTAKPVVQESSLARPRSANDAPLQESFEPTRVLARVGGEPIFVSDLSVEAMQIIDKFIGTAPQSVKEQEVRKLLPRLLPKYIQAKLLLVDALNSLPDGANVDEIYESAGDQFDEGMLPLLMKNVNVESPAKLDAYYRGLGSSLRKVKQSWVESELVKYMMRSKINVNPDVSHREMYEYYLANKEKYAVAAKVNWEQLMVRFDRFPNREAARTSIAEMGSEVVYGAPLSAVAKRSSHGFKAAEGGQQGWTTRGSLVDKNLDNLLFTVEPGKLSEIIETNRGLAIIRVLERNEAGFVPFETSQSEIKEKILSEKQDQEFQKHISSVKQRIPVEVFDPAFVAENPDSLIR